MVTYIVGVVIVYTTVRYVMLRIVVSVEESGDVNIIISITPTLISTQTGMIIQHSRITAARTHIVNIV